MAGIVHSTLFSSFPLFLFLPFLCLVDKKRNWQLKQNHQPFWRFHLFSLLRRNNNNNTGRRTKRGKIYI